MITPAEIREWTDAEVSVGARLLNEEDARRRTLNDAVRQVSQVNTQYLLALGRESGEPWVDPEGTQAAYPRGWIVTFNKKIWESDVDGNMGKPGESDAWRDVTNDPEAGMDEGEPQEWAPHQGQGFSMHERVTHGGKTWISDVDNNVWEPGSGYGWTEQSVETEGTE